MTRSVFLSYCRADSQRVQRLAEDVRALGYNPWLDQEIGGGQAWWNEILKQIRSAEIVVVALSAAALDSVACLREYEYAVALGKAILPICVNADFAPALMPASLAALQVVTWKPDDASAALRLSRALNNLPPSRALPSVEPTPPPAPLSYLVSLHERVTASQELGLKEQSALLVELKQHSRAGKDREELRALMQALRARFDLYASVADELDEVLREQEQDDSAGDRGASEQDPTPASARPPERTASGSLSPIETASAPGTPWRKRKRPMLIAAGACLALAGIGVSAYVLQRPAIEKPAPAQPSLPTPAVASEQARKEDLPAAPIDDKPTEAATADTPPKEPVQPVAATPKPTPAAATSAPSKKRKSPASSDGDPTPRGRFEEVAVALHTWKVTAKQDCEPDTVRPRDCIQAETTRATLNKNGTVTWGACSCKLNAAARKAIEDMAGWIF